MAQDWFEKLRKMMEYVESQERSAQRYLDAGDIDHYQEYSRSASQYREMAEGLMAKYRIDQADLMARDQFTDTPLSKAFVLLGDDRNTSFDSWNYSLFLRIVEHCDCRGYGEYKWDAESRRTRLQATMVGFSGDVGYAELLWSSAHLAFITHVDPKPDPSLSEAENIYRLRKSGMPRKDVAALLWGAWTHSNSAKVGRIFKEEARRRGEDPEVMGKGFDNDMYREAYAREFVWTVTDRLRIARDAAEAQAGALVISGRKERVDEAFYELFPSLRPVEVVVVETEEDNKKRKRVAKRKGPSAAEMKRYHRRYESPSAQAGSDAGARAGRTVNINRVTTGDQVVRVETGSPEVKEIDA